MKHQSTNARAKRSRESRVQVWERGREGGEMEKQLVTLARCSKVCADLLYTCKLGIERYDAMVRFLQTAWKPGTRAHVETRHPLFGLRPRTPDLEVSACKTILRCLQRGLLGTPRYPNAFKADHSLSLLNFQFLLSTTLSLHQTLNETASTNAGNLVHTAAKLSVVRAR